MKTLVRTIGMILRIAAACIFLSAGAWTVSGQAPSAPANPLHREYHTGEKLVYRMNAVNENWKYSLEANGVVKNDGRLYEEYQWTGMESGGQPVALAVTTADWRQRLTLDPGENPSVPDLSKVDPKLIGPVTDMMTFYADLWLANKLGQLKKAGDHFYFRNPMPPSSWADGTRVLLGEDAIDFDMTLKSVDAGAGTAVLEVKHVPPNDSPLPLKAEWMKVPVGSGANNWVEVVRTAEGKYQAGVGEETFTVEITVSLADGRIVSATMDNPVKTIERLCEDEALTKCGDVKPHAILRKIEISLEH
jgi:hypothetical protein